MCTQALCGGTHTHTHQHVTNTPAQLPQHQTSAAPCVGRPRTPLRQPACHPRCACDASPPPGSACWLQVVQQQAGHTGRQGRSGEGGGEQRASMGDMSWSGARGKGHSKHTAACLSPACSLIPVLRFPLVPPPPVCSVLSSVLCCEAAAWCDYSVTLAHTHVCACEREDCYYCMRHSPPGQSAPQQRLYSIPSHPPLLLLGSPRTSASIASM